MIIPTFNNFNASETEMSHIREGEESRKDFSSGDRPTVDRESAFGRPRPFVREGEREREGVLGYKSEVLRSPSLSLSPSLPLLPPETTMNNKSAAAAAAFLLGVVVAVISVADEAGASSIATRDSSGSKCNDRQCD